MSPLLTHLALRVRDEERPAAAALAVEVLRPSSTLLVLPDGAPLRRWGCAAAMHMDADRVHAATGRTHVVTGRTHAVTGYTCGCRPDAHGCRWVEQLRAAGLPQAMPLHEAMGFPGPTQAQPVYRSKYIRRRGKATARAACNPMCAACNPMSATLCVQPASRHAPRLWPYMSRL